MKGCSLLFWLLACLHCSCIAAPTSATFLVKKPQGEAVLVVDTLATPASAVMSLGKCKWTWEPNAGLSNSFEALARRQSTVAVPCAHLGRDANPDPRIYETAEAKSCEINADDARPVALAEKVASSLGAANCDVADIVQWNDALASVARMGDAGDSYCYAFYWNPRDQAAVVRLFAPPCSRPQQLTGVAPGTLTLVAEGQHETQFRFDTLDGQFWRLLSIETGPHASAYLAHWAHSVEKAERGGLVLPKDPLHANSGVSPDAVFRSVRWALALVLSSQANSGLADQLREWMAGIALLNPKMATADIAYRSECDVSSNLPSGCAKP